MLTLLYAVAFAAGLFVLVASAIALGTIRRLRIVPPETVALSPLDVPEEVRALLAPGLQHLLALGFVRPAALRLVSQRVGGRPVPQYALALTHAEVPAVGYVVQLVTPDRARHYSIFFVSRTRDGHRLVTRNRASVIEEPPQADLTVQDVWLPNWSAVWQAHRDKMRAIRPDAAQWVALPAARWIELGADCDAKSFQLRVARGDLVDAGDGSHRFGLRSTLAMLARAWAVLVPSSRAMHDDAVPPAGAASPSIAHPVAAQVEAYERETRARRASRWSRGATSLLFLVTAVVAAVSFGLSMDLGTLLALFAVLLVHELGHLAAMRWAGYTDLKIFFLPFLGAAVVGRHEEPTTWQELIVLFAGPVPGVVVGLAALLWMPPDLPGAAWLTECAVLAVAINAINLLPIHPLDGGKIFEIVLLGRWPWIAFAGRVAGLLALAVVAVSIDDALGRAALLGVVVMLALGLVHQFTEARIVSALRAAGQWGGMSRQDALQALFEVMGRLGYASKPWLTQRVMVDTLLPAVMRPRMKRVSRVSGLIAYVFFLTLPATGLLVYMWTIVPSATQRTAALAQATQPSEDARMARYAAQRNAELEELRARVAATTDAPERWKLLESEFESVAGEFAAYPRGALPAGEALLRDAQALAPTLPDALASQATVAIWMAEAAAEPSVRLQHLRSAMALYDTPQAHAADPGPLMRATAWWLLEAPREARDAHLARIDQALALGGGRPALPGIETVRAFKLDDLVVQGHLAPALDLARGWFEQALRAGDAAVLPAAAQSYVDVMLIRAGPARALELLDRLLVQMESGPTRAVSYTDGLRRHGLWLAEAVGRAEWQREQVQRLPVQHPLGGDASPLSRALLWLATGAHAPGATLADVERAHWLGDIEGARDAARRLLEHRPGFAVTLSEGAGAAQALDAARTKLLHDTRKAVYERYGLAVKVVP